MSESLPAFFQTHPACRPLNSARKRLNDLITTQAFLSDPCQPRDTLFRNIHQHDPAGLGWRWSVLFMCFHERRGGTVSWILSLCCVSALRTTAAKRSDRDWSGSRPHALPRVNSKQTTNSASAIYQTLLKKKCKKEEEEKKKSVTAQVKFPWCHFRGAQLRKPPRPEQTAPSNCSYSGARTLCPLQRPIEAAKVVLGNENNDSCSNKSRIHTK